MATARFYLLLLALFGSSAIARADQPLDSADRFAQLALNIDLEKLATLEIGASVSCEPIFNPIDSTSNTESLRSHGATSELAMAFSQVKCVRLSCALMPSQVAKKAADLKTDPSLEKLMQDLGYSDDEIKQSEQNFQAAPSPPLSCIDNYDMRLAAYSLCTGIPYECHSL